MSDPVIQVQQLSRRFGKKTALDKIDLAIPAGRVFGLVGENGAGKTTLIKHLLGLFKPQTGCVRVFGRDPVADPVGVLGRIGYLSEDRDLPDWMRVGELMTFNQAFYPTWDIAFAAELLHTFGLDPNQKIKSLSRGQRAQVGLLVALAHRPQLLLLDEPSSGLDPVVRRDILSAIIRTVADEGRTVVFSSHLLDEIERVADDVAMIHAGQLVLCGELDDVKAGHHRLTLHYPRTPESAPVLPGALACAGEGCDWTVLANGRVDELRQAAMQAGAQIMTDETPSLEEILVARIRC